MCKERATDFGLIKNQTVQECVLCCFFRVPPRYQTCILICSRLFNLRGFLNVDSERPGYNRRWLLCDSFIKTMRGQKWTMMKMKTYAWISFDAFCRSLLRAIFWLKTPDWNGEGIQSKKMSLRRRFAFCFDKKGDFFFILVWYFILYTFVKFFWHLLKKNCKFLSSVNCCLCILIGSKKYCLKTIKNVWF